MNSGVNLYPVTSVHVTVFSISTSLVSPIMNSFSSSCLVHISNAPFLQPL